MAVLCGCPDSFRREVIQGSEIWTNFMVDDKVHADMRAYNGDLGIV